MTAAARPTYSPTTALVVVDVQHDFADPTGGLSVTGGEDTVPAVNAEVEAARAAGAPVLYTQDWHPASTPHFAKDGGTWPVHCVAGTPGAELHPDLVVAGPVVRKGTGGEDGYSGFSQRDPGTGEVAPTGLDDLLREAGATDVVVVGLALDVCVLETALDARRLGYGTTVLRDATRPVELTAGDGERAVARMQEAGVAVV
ncbi:bifunctional nicotinamidase/pyrazinamidase [Rhodococcus aerolatus]